MCACIIVKVLLYGFSQTYKKRCSHVCLFSRITLTFSYLQAKEKEASKSRNAEKETPFKKWTTMLYSRQSKGLKIRKIRLEFWFVHFGEWLRIRYLIFLKFNFGFYEIRMLITPQVAQLVKNPPAYAGDARVSASIPQTGRSPWTRNGNLLRYFLPGKFHRQRSLTGYSPCGCKELVTTEHVHTYIHTIITSQVCCKE